MNSKIRTLLGLSLAATLTLHAEPVTDWVSTFDPQGNTPRLAVGTESTDSPVVNDADQDCIMANFTSVTLVDYEFIELTGTVSIDSALAGGNFRVGLFDGPAVMEDLANPYLGFYSEAPTGGSTSLKWGPGTNGSHAFGAGTPIVSGYLPGMEREPIKRSRSPSAS